MPSSPHHPPQLVEGSQNHTACASLVRQRNAHAHPHMLVRQATGQPYRVPEGAMMGMGLKVPYMEPLLRPLQGERGTD